MKQTRTNGRWRLPSSTPSVTWCCSSAPTTQLGSMEVSVGKATTAVRFKRATKVFEDAIAAGGAGVRITTMPGVVALEGGVPIVVDGQVIGAIGVSGMLSAQDAQGLRCGLAAIAG
ncbi:MAG: heme-binding protein [Vicinamibacterales bacterium]